MERKKELSFKMKDNLLKFFLTEIYNQTKIALTALDELEKYTEEFYNLFKELNKLQEEKKAIWDIRNAQKRAKEHEKVNAKVDACNTKKCECKIRIWIMIQSFLTATANVSKIFWPPDKNKKTSKAERRRKRGLNLRNELGIPDDNILKKRKFRNHFEHFDERIDKWAEKDGESLGDRMIGSLEALQGFDSKELFRHYNPEIKILTLYTEPYDLEDVKKEIQGIQQKVKCLK